MSFGALFTRIPWKQVIALLPSIVQTARGLLTASKQQRVLVGASSETHQSLVMRVEELEQNERLQVELVQKMAEQQQSLAEGLEFMAARITALLWLAAIALILSLTSIVIVLIK